MKKARTVKIFVLIWIIFVFLFPFATFADLPHDIAAWLSDRGYAVRETGELDILVPDSGVSFKIENLGTLAPGWNSLDLTLLCGETVYSSAKLKVFLENVPVSGAAAAPTAMNSRIPAKTAVVKPGDTVTILLRSGGLLIRSSGKVLKSAGLGETTNVLNIPFNTIVKAVVVDPKNVIMK